MVNTVLPLLPDWVTALQFLSALCWSFLKPVALSHHDRSPTDQSVPARALPGIRRAGERWCGTGTAPAHAQTAQRGLHDRSGGHVVLRAGRARQWQTPTGPEQIPEKKSVSCYQIARQWRYWLPILQQRSKYKGTSSMSELKLLWLAWPLSVFGKLSFNYFFFN